MNRDAFFQMPIAELEASAEKAHFRVGPLAALLAQGQPIKAVAVDLAWSNAAHFVNDFRQKLKATPGRYKAKRQKRR